MNHNKLNNLIELVSSGVKVPYFVNSSEISIDSLDPNKLYAVRSSGNISTPGRMHTELNVPHHQIEKYVDKVLKSAKYKRTTDYLELIDYPVSEFKCSVIIMEMVDSSKGYSGIISNVDPITGTRKLYGKILLNEFGNAIMDGKLRGEDVNNVFDQRKLDDFSQLLSYCAGVLGIKNIELEIASDTLEDIYVIQAREIKLSPLPSPLPLEDFRLTNKFEGESLTNRSCHGIVTRNLEEYSENSIYISSDTTYENLKLILKHSGLLVDRGGSMAHAGHIAREFNHPTIAGVGNLDELKDGTEIFFNNQGNIWILS